MVLYWANLRDHVFFASKFPNDESILTPNLPDWKLCNKTLSYKIGLLTWLPGGLNEYLIFILLLCFLNLLWFTYIMISGWNQREDPSYPSLIWRRNRQVRSAGNQTWIHPWLPSPWAPPCRDDNLHSGPGWTAIYRNTPERRRPL